MQKNLPPSVDLRWRMTFNGAPISTTLRTIKWHHGSKRWQSYEKFTWLCEVGGLMTGCKSRQTKCYSCMWGCEDIQWMFSLNLDISCTQGPFAVGLSIVVFESQSPTEMASFPSKSLKDISLRQHLRVAITLAGENVPRGGPETFWKSSISAFFWCDLQHFWFTMFLKKKDCSILFDSI